MNRKKEYSLKLALLGFTPAGSSLKIRIGKSVRLYSSALTRETGLGAAEEEKNIARTRVKGDKGAKERSERKF